MTKYLIIIIAFCAAFYSCAQSAKSNTINEIIIDSNIKAAVEKNISAPPTGGGMGKLMIYDNRMLVDFYEDDKLIISLKEEEDRKRLFKSFYYWRGDTLNIDGAFGLFGGTGFTVKFVKGKATVYHMLASDEFPSYAYQEKDSLIYRLEVPCNDTKIILSAIPDSTKNQIIYGYVTFKSNDFYMSNGSLNDREILPRKKQRANMRIYFKSAKLDL